MLLFCQLTATSCSHALQEETDLTSAGARCAPRPGAAVYAPARARLSASTSPAFASQGFSIVLAFEDPFDLENNCKDNSYSCLLAVGDGGQVQSGSAQQLDDEGKLFQVRICKLLLFITEWTG